jgi:pterin-4a-carbinolamine dehydratase
MRLLEIMDGYFNPSLDHFPARLTEDVSKFLEWEKISSPERLIKDYTFNGRSPALEFLRQLFLFEDELNHHGKITVQFDTVRVEIYTHDIDAVTELDVEYARVADMIYLDMAEHE